MPPKRKRAGADTAEASTRSTRKSTRTIRGKGAGAEKPDVSVPDNSADGVEDSTPPPLKKTRGKGTKAVVSKSEAGGSTGRGTKAILQASTCVLFPLCI
ncbi:hypothetical protein PAXRUDRAFT_344553 [Paxillus rubicundulus Ve08.2h10]|uniref:Uncharacterized protein n=1 Tax=Paxillus rubicundulus Ve08.2h10 TaxID=930991 RepID=A0A0D0DZJ4_9AGAM|nr:hypothetical protein PAXRUDRAFT_344553 [Paxillus rubicundulus Ve08.2h10]